MLVVVLVNVATADSCVLMVGTWHSAGGFGVVVEGVVVTGEVNKSKSSRVGGRKVGSRKVGNYESC
jgi:hypothetical protein